MKELGIIARNNLDNVFGQLGMFNQYTDLPELEGPLHLVNQPSWRSRLIPTITTFFFPIAGEL